MGYRIYDLGVLPNEFLPEFVAAFCDQKHKGDLLLVHPIKNNTEKLLMIKCKKSRLVCYASWLDGWKTAKGLMGLSPK